jgi:hypothetical protein
MYRYLKHHIFQYLIILILFGITVTALISPIDYAQKILFTSITLLIYFFWAIWHHWEDHKLNLATILEYLAIVALLFWLLINIGQ